MRGMFAEAVRTIDSPRHRPKPETWSPHAITFAWIGHATVLVNLYGTTILTDPLFFPRIGATLPFGTVGPKRFVAPALRLAQLPPLDLVLLSHAHLDHLDTPSLRHLRSSPQAITAHRTSDLLRASPLQSPVELRWGERAVVETSAGDLTVEAIEVNHWGARWRHDRYRGYNGYILSKGGRTILFGGDTAMSASFEKVRKKGPFAAALMPIGSYRRTPSFHCTPEEAVRMANAAGAEIFLPIHHRTFAMGDHSRTEPIERLERVLAAERIGWREIGETFILT